MDWNREKVNERTCWKSSAFVGEAISCHAWYFSGVI